MGEEEEGILWWEEEGVGEVLLLRAVAWLF
jgi:hypothetical protein